MFGISVSNVNNSNSTLLKLPEVIIKLSTMGLLNNEYKGNINQIDMKRKAYIGSIKLSLREAQCLHYLVRGKTIKGIANELNLSKNTIETYYTNLKFKLNIYNKSKLVEMAIEHHFG